MRLIDADALIATMENMRSISNNVKQRQIEESILHGIVPQIIDDEPTIEAEPVKQVTELSIILQDYGIKDTDTLRYILDQYQKIIIEITGGQMSYLTYPAETVIACANDNYRKCYEESMQRGRWELISQNKFTGTKTLRCTYCKNYFVVRDDTLNAGRCDANFCPNCGSKNRMDGDNE